MKYLIKKKILKASGFHMFKYKDRIVFTGGTGRFAQAFKLKQNETNLNFYFPKKKRVGYFKYSFNQKMSEKN